MIKVYRDASFSHITRADRFPCSVPPPQMAVLEIQSNGESSYVSQEAINSAILFLEDPLQRVSARRHTPPMNQPGPRPSNQPLTCTAVVFASF